MYKAITLPSVIHSSFCYKAGCKTFCVSKLLHTGEWKEKFGVSFLSVSAPVVHVLKAKIPGYLHRKIKIFLAFQFSP